MKIVIRLGIKSVLEKIADRTNYRIKSVLEKIADRTNYREATSISPS